MGTVNEAGCELAQAFIEGGLALLRSGDASATLEAARRFGEVGEALPDGAVALSGAVLRHFGYALAAICTYAAQETGIDPEQLWGATKLALQVEGALGGVGLEGEGVRDAS